MAKIVYQADERGIFVGAIEADESPLEPGVWLIPRGAVEASPPPIPEGQRARFTDGAWLIEAADLPVPTPVDDPPPDATLAERKAVATARVDAARDLRLTGGFTVPAVASTGLAGQILQTRDADDRLNWLLSESAYRDAAAAGQGDAVAAQFRSAANVTTTVSVVEGLAVLRAMKAWGTGVMARSWALKDAITAAADEAALEAIDITAGWPE